VSLFDYESAMGVQPAAPSVRVALDGGVAAGQAEARAQHARAARDEERKAIGLAVASALAEHLGKAATK